MIRQFALQTTDNRNRRRGHSLIELLVALPAFAILTVSSALALKVVFAAQTQDRSLFSENYQAANILEMLGDQLEEATAIAYASPAAIEY